MPETGSDIGSGNNYISFKDGTDASLGAIQGNGAGAVVLAGPGNDYAEYLPRRHTNERIQPGEVVGIIGGKVTKTTAGADMILAASTGAIVAGNDPGKENRKNFSLVAFVGQVDVRMRGPISAGDFVLPSSLNDGTAIAVAREDLQLEDVPSILGQAWEDKADPGTSPVRVSVGMVQLAALGSVLQRIDRRLQDVERALASAANSRE